jgi:hypothetical protein
VCVLDLEKSFHSESKEYRRFKTINRGIRECMVECINRMYGGIQVGVGWRKDEGQGP